MRPDRQIIYQTAIQHNVNMALEQKETQFASDHATDTDAQLLQYLCGCAKELCHTPYPKEIVGGRMIEARFETWDNALRAAGLPRPTTANKVSAFALVIEETKHQEELYRQRKIEKRQRHQQRVQKQMQAQKQYLQDQTKKK